jgi:hypothetical protein
MLVQRRSSPLLGLTRFGTMRSPASIRVCVLICLLVAWLPARSFAQDLERARQAYFDARFHEAIVQFETLLAQPSLTADEALQAHRYLAALRHSNGDTDGALGHAEAAVALDPTVTAAEGSPPDVEELMDAARLEFAGRSALLRIEVRATPGDAGTRAVRAWLEPAPEALVSDIMLRCVGDPRPTVVESSAPPEVELVLPPAEVDRHCTASARTGGGATLFQASESVPAAPIAPIATTMPSPFAPTALDPSEQDSSPWPWIAGVAGAVALVAGVILVVILTSSNDNAPVLERTTVPGWESP